MPTTIDTAFLDTMPPNVAVQFFDRVTATPDAEAFRFPRGEAWESVTWKQAGDKVEALAAGLIALGVEPEQRVGIASGTRYEWILADLAVMCAAGATTTVYPTHQRRGHRLHPGRLREPRRLRRGRRAGRQAHRAPLRAAPRRRRSSPSRARPTATG